MKVQWSLFFSLVFALLVAIFAHLINVEAVTVRSTGSAQVTSIARLVILLSAFIWRRDRRFYGIFRQYALQLWDIRHLKKHNPADHGKERR
ncbi:MAG: DUF1049 domain-containing protein [Candidatus Carbobacillus altaicus]|nr:DUF1049 domain-containing protein [Candidatus Carbobacillus altaicus]